MSEPIAPTIESVLQEQRSFDPPAALAAQARIGSMEAYRALAERAQSDPDGFWGDLARQELQQHLRQRPDLKLTIRLYRKLHQQRF